MKKAFSIIEIVFSIVVISVALISIATISRQNAKSNVMAVKQELVKLSKTQLMNIISSPWDSSQLINLCVFNDSNQCVYEGTALIAFKIYDLSSEDFEQKKRLGIVQPTSLENWFETRLSGDEKISTVLPANKSCFGKKCPDNSIGFAWAPDAMNDIDDWDEFEYTIQNVNTNEDAEGTGRTSGDFIFTAKLFADVDYGGGAIDATNTSSTISYNFPITSAGDSPTNTKIVSVTAAAFDPKNLDKQIENNVTLRAYSFNIGDALEVASKCWGTQATCENYEPEN